MIVFELKDATVRVELRYTVSDERMASGFRPIWAAVELLSGRVVDVRVGGPRIRVDGSDGAPVVQNRTHMIQPAWLDDLVADALSRWGMYTSRAADS
jgi:hypothetical protein